MLPEEIKQSIAWIHSLRAEIGRYLTGQQADDIDSTLDSLVAIR